jgi:coenzyme F420-reducing hydrogenase delta subunit
MILEVPCFKALDPVHVINALHSGFDGVMAVVCATEDCKLQEGKETAERNMSVLKNALKKMDLSDRFELFMESPRSKGDFKKNLEAFYCKISTMPLLEPQKVEAKVHV